jgi:hypothetical protein
MNQHPLTIKQKRILGIEATKAYDVEARAGRLQLPAEVATCSLTARREFWRHTVIAGVTRRVASASDMWQDEYLPVLREFQRLSGNSGKAYHTSVRQETGAACHCAPGCDWVRDMYHWMNQAGFKDGYVAVIMFAKFKTRDITRLSEGQLKQLHDTVVNRCRAKLKLGDTENRNKKQRKALPAGQASTPPPSPSARAGRDYVLKPAARPSPAPSPSDDPF